ncbi:baseplate J/gp47 family protein [Paenibacillus rhizophilus]|uniref:Baseplate J/gp47 family protein n=1 Tax=Paenibacillus rhizophilus TaxID=1850366 RepID=A0A3N9P8P4_9BACL|nr:baseplate J/gp47 family protein [Paenibacillus rhizophilus]RQW11850.1 baseplate J/gp47 family protein [Paenibacillus rhizophilus]
MLDSTGFKRPRFDDLFAQMEDKAKEAFGDTVNTSVRSPLGIILRIFAWFLSILWSLAEDVYNSGYIGTATGNNLDRLGPQVGISRILEQWAMGTVTLTGTAGYTVSAGFRVATESGLTYQTTDDVTLTGGTGNVAIEALASGSASNVAAGTITVIVNPSADVTGVTNVAPVTGGREKETDAEFRDRFEQSTAGGGAATVDSIRSALLRLDGVRAATVIENTGLTADGAGRPGKSFQAYVLGGDDQAIAGAIFSTKAGGIEPYGTISKTVTDLAGEPHTVKFSRATEVGIKVNVDITKGAAYPADGDAQVRSALIRYIGGADAPGAYYNGLNMGADVVFTRLISAIYSVEGVGDVTLTVGKTSGSLGSSNVVIQPYEVAQAAAANVVVTSHV